MSDSRCSKTPVETINKPAMAIYFVESLITILVNVGLLAVILHKKIIRSQKERLLYAGCMFIDIIFALAFLLTATHRLSILLSNEYIPYTTMYNCLIDAPQNILFIYIIPQSGVMSVTYALDRMFGVFSPLQYYHMTTRYTYLVLFFSFVPPFIFVIIAFITSYQHDSVHNRFRNAQTKQISGGGMKYIRTTITILLITVNTLVFYTIPDLIMLVEPTARNDTFFIFSCSKGLVNIIIFFSTQRTLRNAVFAAFRTSANVTPKILPKSNSSLKNTTATE